MGYVGNLLAHLLIMVFLFEAQTRTAQHQLPAGWKTGGSTPEDYDIFIDHAVKRGGGASACMKSKAGEPLGSGVLLQAFKADDYLGKRVRMTAFVKTKSVAGHAGLWMRVDSRNMQLALDNMGDRKLQGTIDWRQYAVVLDVPKGAAGIYFGILLAGNGQVWVDDFKFEGVGKDVPTTGIRFQARKRSASPDDLPKQPENLGFEQ